MSVRALCAAGLVFYAATAAAQPEEAGDAGPAPAEVSPDSPRASVAGFLEAGRVGRWEEAAKYLEIPDDVTADPGLLARHLKAVLDRWSWLDLERISPRAEGNLHDGLPPQYEQVGEVPGPKGNEPVRLERVAALDGPRWRFSRSTVSRIETWFGRLENRWLLDLVPEPLLRTGPANIQWWQWLAMPILLVVAFALGALLGKITRWIVSLVVRRTTVTWDDELLRRLARPITLLWTVAGVYLLLPALGIYEPAQMAVNRGIHTAVFIIVLWALVRSVGVAFSVAAQSHWAVASPGARSLLGLAGKVSKLAVMALAVVAVLSQLGYPVASLLAGLGIGGIALALAAQKTVENVFGAFSLAVDQPFREGDFVKIEDFVGTVETIGLRSTRIRTLERTLITLPNGKLADMRIETFAPRDRIRFNTVVGLVYGTTAAQVREILAGFEKALREHPKIWPDVVQVNLQSFGEWALRVEIQCWFQTSDWGEFLVIRQDVQIQLMEIVERAGTRVAIPAREIHLPK